MGRNLFGILILLMMSMAVLTACQEKEQKSSPAKVVEKQAAPKPQLENKGIEKYQADLLELAFSASTAIPVYPHIKDRSKHQGLVVEAWLKLDQPKTAYEKLAAIENWRKGEMLASLAVYCLQNESPVDVTPYLKEAEEIAETAEDWRRDTVRVKVAQANLLMGEKENAARLEGDVVESQTGKLAAFQSELTDNASFDEQVKRLDDLIATQTFDIVKNALEGYVDLYGRFYSDQERRRFLENKIFDSWSPMPFVIRFEMLKKLAQIALEKDDKGKAMEFVEQAQEMAESDGWRLEHQIAMLADLVKLRYKAGDIEKAGEKADSALTLFLEKGNTIVNIWRAGALRPLAEAYQVMGNREKALEVYKMALEEGVVNPNSRPRAEDLSQTCISMATIGFQPSEALWARMREIRKELSHPW